MKKPPPSGHRYLPALSRKPRISAARKAPQRLPMPPIATTIRNSTRYWIAKVGDRPTMSIASPPPSAAMPLPKAKVSVNSRSTLMPTDWAMRRLSTAARICAPSSVRSNTSHSSAMNRRPDQDQEDAIGREGAKAEVDRPLEPVRQPHRHRRRAVDEGHRRGRHEHEPDRQHHLVELGRVVEARVEQPLEHDAAGADQPRTRSPAPAGTARRARSSPRS